MLLMTGFPGFLASELLPRLLAADETQEAVCLVQPRYAHLGRRSIGRLRALNLRIAERVSLVEATSRHRSR